MVLEVTLPFSVLNNAPFARGIDDVTLRIPQPPDIIEIIQDNTVDELQIGQAVDRVLNDFFRAQENFTELVEAVGNQVRQEFIDAGEETVDIADETASRTAGLLGGGDSGDFEVNLQGQLFAIEEDFERIIERAFDTADLEVVDQFPTLEGIRGIVSEETPDAPDIDLPELVDIGDELENRLPDLPDDGIPGLDAIQSAAEEAVDTAIRALPDGDLLTDLDSVVDNQIDRVTGGIVDDGPFESLQEANDSFSLPGGDS